MRKLYILGMILGMYATFSACNDEWKDSNLHTDAFFQGTFR